MQFRHIQGLGSNIVEKLESIGFTDVEMLGCPGDEERVKNILTEEEWFRFQIFGEVYRKDKTSAKLLGG